MRLASISLLTLTVGACGPGGAIGGSDDATASSSTSATQTSSESSSASTTTDGGGTGMDGGACTFEDPPDIANFAVEVTNTHAQAIYVQSALDCSILEPFELRRNGEGLRWQLDYCEFTCANLADGVCACPDLCPQDQVHRIEAGATMVISWPGVVMRPETIDPSCAPDCPSDCFEPTAAASGAAGGTYTFRVEAGTSVTACGVECMCADPGGPWCTHAGRVDGPVMVAEAEGVYDIVNGGSVSVVF